ncbi:hypothetical protein RB195_014920 [Necator americanus]|uniref:7TM GPCR serpentine receptor class x (Srx) domain-containing protein n=1 Tax=Necator americanus TaxID=51031 RepID=A0ABR1E2A4_NECAM
MDVEVDACLAKSRKIPDSSRSDTVMIILATPNTLGFWGYLFSSFAFAGYRFGIFMSKNLSERTGIVKFLIIFPWILTTIFTIGSVAIGCYKRFNRFALLYTYSCSYCNILPGMSYTDVNFYGGQVLPLMMVVSYAIIVISVYRNRRIHGAIQRRQCLVDARLAFQFIIICLSQYLAAFLFYIVPKMSAGADWGVLVTNSIGTINVSVNPIVLLLWNQQIRSSIATTLGRWRGTQKIVNVTVTQMINTIDVVWKLDEKQTVRGVDYEYEGGFRLTLQIRPGKRREPLYFLRNSDEGDSSDSVAVSELRLRC